MSMEDAGRKGGGGTKGAWEPDARRGGGGSTTSGKGGGGGTKPVCAGENKVAGDEIAETVTGGGRRPRSA